MLRSVFVLFVLAVSLAGIAAEGPVENRYFMAVDGAEAEHRLLGAIHIPEHAMQTNPAELRPERVAGKRTQLFPGITVHFVSHGEYLLPVERDLLAPVESDSFWQIQISPGRTWYEKTDDGMSRASFPFILTSNIENETYNGIATFLFDDDGVSSLRYQVVHQLSPFLVETWFTAWGQVDVDYQPGGVDEETVIAEFEQELADRLVWKDWSELEDTYGAELLENFDSGIAPEKTVMSGLAIDGEVYLRSADTPFGPYPYPQEMRHGVWSVSKTATGLVTLLRMAQKYGDEIFDYRITDYLDVSAEHDGWDEVTFADALNMATGIGTGSNDNDPNNIYDGYIYSDYDEYLAWYLAPTLDEKLQYVFDVPSHPWGPGEHARYRDRDTLTLAAALDSLYREKEGEDADLWGMMLDEVYGPLGIHHMPMNLTKESDRPGVPFLGWGLYATADDMVKIAQLLQNDGVHDGVQLLSKKKLAEALYQTEVRGLPTGSDNQYGANSYHLSVWHNPYESDSGKRYSTPRMLGWGGVVIQMMPNGMTAFRFGNGGSRAFEQAVRITDNMRPFDTAGSKMNTPTLTDAAKPAPPEIMTAAAIVEFPDPEADHIITYGDDPLQFGELRLPEGPGPFPVIVYVHGGCWYSEYDIAHSRKLTDAFTAEGIAVWSLEYRRIGDPGGGWPGTFEDVEAGFAHLSTLADRYSLDLDRVILSGHSAGGHLALWLAQRIEEQQGDDTIAPRGVLTLAPAPDLEFLHASGACGNAATKLMGGSPEEFPERYAYGSVANRIPQSTPQIAVVGKYDEMWRPVGVRYAKSAAEQGAPISVIDAPESGHFEMIDPDSSTWPLVLGAARELLNVESD